MKVCDEKAYQKGKLEGLLEGEYKGKLEGKLETAKAMLAKGLDMKLIVEVTGLSLEEIEHLRH